MLRLELQAVNGVYDFRIFNGGVLVERDSADDLAWIAGHFAHHVESFGKGATADRTLCYYGENRPDGECALPGFIKPEDAPHLKWS